MGLIKNYQFTKIATLHFALCLKFGMGGCIQASGGKGFPVGAKGAIGDRRPHPKIGRNTLIFWNCRG
jgi:hypothetical protein